MKLVSICSVIRKDVTDQVNYDLENPSVRQSTLYLTSILQLSWAMNNHSSFVSQLQAEIPATAVHEAVLKALLSKGRNINFTLVPTFDILDGHREV